MMTVDAERDELPAGFRYAAAFGQGLATTRVCNAPCHLRIAPVPGLAHGPGRGLGVFNAGAAAIPAGACLGVYVGEVQQPGARDEGSDYAFRVNGLLIVDAAARGNWTRFVNGSSSPAAANLVALDNSAAEPGKPGRGAAATPLPLPRLRDHEVCFVATRSISPGEQLRFYYGDEYGFDEEGISPRSLDAFASRALLPPSAPGPRRRRPRILELERTRVRRGRG